MQSKEKQQLPKIDMVTKKKKNWKVRGVVALSVSILLFTVMIWSAIKISAFYDTNRVYFQAPVIFQAPVVIEQRKPVIVSPLPEKKEASESASIIPAIVPKAEAHGMELVKQPASNPSDYEIATLIASYDWDYDTAIRIAKSENFWNLTKSFDCKRQGGVNNNGTRDHGLWQINDIHIRSGAITLEDALDCKKATQFAYGLYKARNNWTAWSAYNNGSYLNHSIIEL